MMSFHSTCLLLLLLLVGQGHYNKCESFVVPTTSLQQPQHQHHHHHHPQHQQQQQWQYGVTADGSFFFFHNRRRQSLQQIQASTDEQQQTTTTEAAEIKDKLNGEEEEPEEVDINGIDQQQQDQQQLMPELPTVEQRQQEIDEIYMQMAIEEAELAANDTFPKPNVGAVLVAEDGRVLGQGHADYQTDAIVACLQKAGLDCTPLAEWCVTWPDSEQLRQDLATSTLYVTLEPSHQRQGTAVPSQTQLIQQAGIARIVIGAADPIASRATQGARTLHQAGLIVSLGSALPAACQDLIRDYASLANSKLHRMARQHYRLFGRPLGFLHCSVVESNNIEAFQRHGNAFGTKFGGQHLGYRDFGSYEIAPPPEVIWADDSNNNIEDEMMDYEEMMSVDFEEEELSADIMPVGSPMMPWYEQVDAVVGTFPRQGNGPPDDDSLMARLNGLKWLATHGNELPKNVERILVMDATDLLSLPLDNKNPNLPKGVDVEAFWKGHGRKRTRVLLRRGANERARAAAVAAANAAKAAAQAAQAAADAIESGDAALAAQAAMECKLAAQKERDFAQAELEKTQKIKDRLEEMGVLVETLEGGEPVDIMNYLGKRNGYQTVVWRAGCWSDRGVRAVLAGAFQWVSAHLAVDAVGGRFWQLMLAENAVQAALGPLQKVKIFADHDDLSLEYCDQPDADDDCSMTIDGRPVRHVRLDCRVALVDQSRKREVVLDKTKPFDQKYIEEQAPWFL